jgi:hypothetical protein
MEAPMNEADDDATIKREAASSVPIDSPTPTTGLSPEDEAVVMRWRAEVGDERLRRIAVALAAGRPGRKSEEPDRKHLLLMMAQFSRAHPNAKPYRLAQMVVASSQGMAECTRSNTTPDALNRWLRVRWTQKSAKLKRAVAAAEQCPSSFNLRRLLETAHLIDTQLKSKSVPDWLQNLVFATNQANAAMAPVLQSLLASREATAIGNSLAGPVPPGL